jgi:hypothetical protein
MRHLLIALSALALAGCGGEPEAPRTPGPATSVPALPAGPVDAAPGARVYFIEPEDGAVLTNPVRVVFGLSGMGVAPAGVHQDATGHHHLLINDPPYHPEAPLPATDQIVHFGGGQTQTTLTLPPGTHTLQLLLGDWKHQPHNPPVLSEKITITVE